MTGQTRGVLYPARLPRFTRLPAPAAAEELVRWFWIPEWDLEPGRTSRQHVVAHPGCNVVVDSRDGGFVGFAGPTTRRSHQDLSGRGWAVGAHLRPAAVPAFTDDPAAARDSYRPLREPELFAAVAAQMATSAPDRLERAVAVLADHLVQRCGPVTEEARAANELAALVDGDPTVLRLEDAADRLRRSPRTLQRLARRYVGLPPAAMIRRRRLQEAAERVRTDRTADLAAIAADLGYADHAHLTNDFRTVLGTAPSEYRREHRDGDA
ncbi:helix-turn-helix domain-containing protein [Kineococcus sp. SYSU DK003]|uniref:helix-turn-helix domain-containing protein n=1 Tax=Kineococcus sp. SYSU DK003 TaxID=3383124 RepID=UPI003D7E6255